MINGKGELIHLVRDQSNDKWLATTASVGLVGIIACAKPGILAYFKVYANQTTLNENDVLNGLEKFHLLPYAMVPIDTPGQGYQVFLVSQIPM
ncbi:hypothetical protein BDN72DRAFT_841300 [Pluteus cervinus]|uniref:Uncharacterized protein n=1 Tax=Pluteus cervinus TaxID=181527 RepID=A0ACD3AV45_9AGAR|nr:hypothetical protein BDN72DRAFT_841300 [Pluteus cervinus]